MSESQERMMAVVEPGNVDAFLAICDKWDVEADRDRRGHRHRPARDRLARRDRRRRAAAHRRPRRARSTSGRSPGPPGRTRCRPTRAERCRARRPARSCGRRCCGWSARPNLCDKSWVTDQYDRYVRGNTVLAQPEDAGMVRVDEETGLGVALATDCNGRFAKLDPYAGAQLALAEAYRNVATGGRAAARGHRLPELRLARGPRRDVAVRRGRAGASRTAAWRWASRSPAATSASTTRPATTAIQPTPVVAVLGVIDDVTRRTPAGLRRRRAQLVLLLGETREELVGSEWAHVVHGHLGGLPPRGGPRRRAGAGRAARRRGARRAASRRARPVRRRAGPGAGRVRACATASGASVALSGDPFVALFSESAGRALVAVRPGGRRGGHGALPRARRTGGRAGSHRRRPHSP